MKIPTLKSEPTFFVAGLVTLLVMTLVVDVAVIILMLLGRFPADLVITGNLFFLLGHYYRYLKYIVVQAYDRKYPPKEG